jgi:hypothetical protein
MHKSFFDPWRYYLNKYKAKIFIPALIGAIIFVFINKVYHKKDEEVNFFYELIGDDIPLGGRVDDISKLYFSAFPVAETLLPEVDALFSKAGFEKYFESSTNKVYVYQYKTFFLCTKRLFIDFHLNDMRIMKVMKSSYSVCL